MNGSWAQMGSGFKRFKAPNDLGSIQFEGSTVQIVQFVQGFQWFKGSISPMVQIGQGLK